MHERSEDARRLIAALIGGQLGAAVGLLFFGGLLFVPILVALIGSGVGAAWVPARGWLRQKAAARYFRTAIRN
jgi:uncharacterized protein (DUF697 family)